MLTPISLVDATKRHETRTREQAVPDVEICHSWPCKNFGPFYPRHLASN
jgi:hypothetical protein